MSLSRTTQSVHTFVCKILQLYRDCVSVAGIIKLTDLKCCYIFDKEGVSAQFHTGNTRFHVGQLYVFSQISLF